MTFLIVGFYLKKFVLMYINIFFNGISWWFVNVSVFCWMACLGTTSQVILKKTQHVQLQVNGWELDMAP